MNSSIDLTLLNLLRLNFTFKAISNNHFIIPSTLTQLTLSIDDGVVDKKLTPLLQFNNSKLKQIHLECFKYETPIELTLNCIPNNIFLSNCSNISFQSSTTPIPDDASESKIGNISIFDCSNISIKLDYDVSITNLSCENLQNTMVKTKQSYFETTKQISFFCQIVELVVVVKSQYVNIQLPPTILSLTFMVNGLGDDNQNLVQNSVQKQIEYPITSIDNSSLRDINLERINNLTFNLPTTIRSISLSSCENLTLTTNKKHVIDTINCHTNTNCKFNNIIINTLISSELAFELLNTGIQYGDVIFTKGFLNNTNEVIQQLIEISTILGEGLYERQNIDSIT
ncbi:hypothetical protein QTN25_009419 [Entamoeba marina]